MKKILAWGLLLFSTLFYGYSMNDASSAAAADVTTVMVDGILFESHYTKVNKIRLHYLIAGNGNKPVLLIHGFPGSWHR